jgi:hypothetical protein
MNSLSLSQESFTISGLYYYPRYFDTVNDKMVINILYNLTMELEACMHFSETEEYGGSMTTHVIPALFRFMHKIRQIMLVRRIVTESAEEQ